MEGEQQGNILDQLFRIFEQLLIPPWNELVGLIPAGLLALVVLWLVFVAVQWRRADSRYRSRVPPPVPAGEPPPGIHLPGPSKWPFVVPIGLALILFSLAVPPRDEAGQITLPVNLPLFGLGMLITLVAVGGWLIDAMREWRATAITAETPHAAEAALAPGARPIGALPERADVARREPPPEPPPGVHMPGPTPWPFFAPLAITLLFFGMILHPALVIGGLALCVIVAAGWLREAGHDYRTTEQVGHPVPATRDPQEAWPRWLVIVFAVVAVLSVGIALLPVALTAVPGLAPAETSEATEAPSGVPAVPEITARTIVSFETDLLVVPAGRPFELVFHNEQDGVPHDVAITESAARETVYFDGEDIVGPQTITYEVPALDEGDYYFLCTVHPNMNGTVEARPE